MFSEIQRILVDQGLDHSTIVDICLLLQRKSRNVQQAFLLKTRGFSPAEIAYRLGIETEEIDQLLGDELDDINNYLNTSMEQFQLFAPYR